MKRIVYFLLAFFLCATNSLFTQTVNPSASTSYPVNQAVNRCPDCGFFYLEDTALSWNVVLGRYGDFYCNDAGDVFHPGWDMNYPSESNTPVYPIADGVVYKTEDPTVTGYQPINWCAVLVKHNIGGQTYYSVYGHMKRIDVREGDVVTAGVTQLGLVGSIGATSPHLHLEIRMPNHPNLNELAFWNCSTDPTFGLHNLSFVDNNYWNPEQFIKGIPAVGMQRNEFHPNQGQFLSTYLSHQQVGSNPWDVNQFYDRIWDNGNGDIYVHYWPNNGNPDQAGHADALWVQDFKNDQTQEWSQLVFNPAYNAVVRTRGKILEYWNSHSGYSAYGPPIGLQGVGEVVSSNGTHYQNAAYQQFRKGANGQVYTIFVNPTNQLAEVTTEGVVGGALIQTRQATITSSPSGASIYLQGGLLGVAPMTTYLFEGASYQMTAKLSGYQDTPFSFTVGSQDMTVPVTMLPLGSTGTLSVSTDPAGAEIWFDGSRWPTANAVTPQYNIEVPVGVHPIRFVKSGYQPYEQNVAINQGQLTQLLGITLQPPPGTKPTGNYTITSEPTGATVNVWVETGLQIYSNLTTPTQEFSTYAWSLDVEYAYQGLTFDTTFSVVNNEHKTIHKVMHPILSVSTTALHLGNAQSGTLSGSFNVSNATNVGTLLWNVSKVGNISVSPTSGTNAGTVNVSALLDGLADGSYRDTVFVSSNYGNAQVIVRYFKGNPPTFSDDFNRTELGSNWEIVGGASITNNQARLGQNGTIRCLGAGTMKNAEVEFDLGTFDHFGNDVSGVFLRYIDANNYCSVSTSFHSAPYSTLIESMVNGQYASTLYGGVALQPGRYLVSIVDTEVSLVNVNGGTSVNLTWNHASLSSLSAGRVALWTNECFRNFDNVTIRNLDVQPPTVVNLIKDPECTEPFYPWPSTDGWLMMDDEQTGTHDVSFSASSPLSGSSSVLVYNSAATSAWTGVKQLMDLIAGHDYRVSFLVQAEQTGPFSTLVEGLSTVDWQGQGAYHTYNVTNQRALISYQFNCRSTAQTIMAFQLGNVVGNARMDSVSVVDLTNPPPSNPVLSVSTTNLNLGGASTGTLSGSFNISNTGNGTLSWTNTKDGNITVSPLSGTNAGTVNVSVTVDGVSVGAHTDHVYVSSNGGNATVNVSYTVNSPPSGGGLIADSQFNGPFVSDGTYGGWIMMNDAQSGVHQVSLSTQTPLSGASSLLAYNDVATGSWTGAKQKIDLTQGHNYKVSFIVKSESAGSFNTFIDVLSTVDWIGQGGWYSYDVTSSRTVHTYQFNCRSTAPSYIAFHLGNVVGNSRLDSVFVTDLSLPKVVPSELEETTIPTSFHLYQNHPNPFNPVTTIVFDIPEKSRTTLSVYNLVGQKVATLIEGDVEAGQYRVQWDTRLRQDFGGQAAFIPSGIYLYELKAGSYRKVRKMVVVK